MDIKKIISDYNNASESDKVTIKENLRTEFSFLSEDEKKEVQRMFMEGLNDTIEEAKDVLKEVNLKIELERVSQYISMSYIAKNFFGKSRQWLNNRIKGNYVNGKPAVFTIEEISRFSFSLEKLCKEINNKALRICH
jgi:hypothetical protein